MSVKFKIRCKDCTQEFFVDVDIPDSVEGEVDFDFKGKLLAPCPTCRRDVMLPNGAYAVSDGHAELVPEESEEQ